MKRNHNKIYEYGLYRHFSLFFWQQCISCKKDFRRERGWRFLVGPFHGGLGSWVYLCSTCAPTKQRANTYAIDKEYLPKKPPAPPPPPKPRVYNF